MLDESGRLLTLNATLKKNLSSGNNAIVPGKMTLSSFFQEPEEFDEFIRNALRSGQLESHDFILKVPDNMPPIWVHCLLSRVEDESGTIQIEGVLFNITERIALVDAITYEANHDKLTGLLRGPAAKNEFEIEEEYDDLRASFLFLDLDGFKQINDTYGHMTGDEVLIATSKRLRICARDTDIVCRLGGDEFLIILIDCSEETAVKIAKNVIASIQQNIIIGNGVEVNIGVSIGVAHLNADMKGFDALTESADEAMYQVKKTGKNNYFVSEGKKAKLIRVEEWTSRA